MDKIETAFGALPLAIDEAREPAQETRGQCTPRGFLKQAGMVILVCLGLTMLTQVLVIIVGEY